MLNIIKAELSKSFSQKKMLVFIIFVLGLPLAFAGGTELLLQTPEIKNNPEFLKQFTFSNLDFPLQTLASVTDLILPVFVTLLVADKITEEYKQGTLKLPLITPIKRSRLLIAKLITIALEITILYSLLLVSSYIVGTLFYGFSDTFYFQGVTLNMANGITYTLAAYGITILTFTMFAMFITIIAVIFKSSSSVIGLSLAVVIITSLLSTFSQDIREYMLTNYLMFFRILFVDATTREVIKGVIIAALYGIIPFSLSIYLFKKKDLVY